MIQNQLKVLTDLAKTDGILDSSEEKIIRRIGITNGMTEAQVKEILNSPNPEYDLNTFEVDEKFDLLFHAIEVMKVDGKVYNEEVRFCEKLALELGFELSAVMELYGSIHPNVKISGQKEQLKRKVMSMQKK
jgi:uncharacterized tellurite resistance protein B-like protein